MIDFAHEEVLLFLALLAFGDVLSGAGHADGPSLTPGALEMTKPQLRRPTDLAASPPEPELGRGTLRIDRIERRRDGCPKSFHVVRMHRFQELFDRRLILGNIENFLTALIPRDHAGERIVLPRPELSGVEGKLETVFALAQQIGGLSKLRHERVDLGDGGCARQQRAALARRNCSASRVADRVRDYPAQP